MVPPTLRRDGGPAHGTFKSSMTGSYSSSFCTAIPFWLVMGNVLNDTLKTSLIIMAVRGVQIVFHMIYFLHMNTKSEGGLDLHCPRLHPHSRRGPP
jgi:cytochrome o ubiquinol oxidase operon protein cyoD